MHSRHMQKRGLGVGVCSRLIFLLGRSLTPPQLGSLVYPLDKFVPNYTVLDVFPQAYTPIFYFSVVRVFRMLFRISISGFHFSGIDSFSGIHFPVLFSGVFPSLAPGI